MSEEMTQKLAEELSNILRKAAKGGQDSIAVEKAVTQIAEIFIAIKGDLEETIDKKQGQIDHAKRCLTRMQRLIELELSSLDLLENLE